MIPPLLTSQYIYVEEVAPIQITLVVTCGYQWVLTVLLRCARIKEWLTVTALHADESHTNWTKFSPKVRPIGSAHHRASAHRWPTDT